MSPLLLLKYLSFEYLLVLLLQLSSKAHAYVNVDSLKGKETLNNKFGGSGVKPQTDRYGTFPYPFPPRLSPFCFSSHMRRILQIVERPSHQRAPEPSQCVLRPYNLYRCAPWRNSFHRSSRICIIHQTRWRRRPLDDKDGLQN